MTDLRREVDRLNREVRLMCWQEPSLSDMYAAEAPLRIHTRDIDAGGGPAFHPRFMAWLDDGPEERSEYVAERFHPTKSKMHPRRLKRALRQLRTFAPAEFDIVYLIVARGMDVEQAWRRINDERAARRQPIYTQTEFAVLTLSGLSILTAAY